MSSNNAEFLDTSEERRIQLTHEYTFYRPGDSACVFDGIKDAPSHGFDSGYNAGVDNTLGQRTVTSRNNTIYDGGRQRHETRVIQSKREWEELRENVKHPEICDPNVAPFLQTAFSLLDEPRSVDRGSRLDDRIDICFNSFDCRQQDSIVEHSEMLKHGLNSRQHVKQLYDKNIKPKWASKF